METLRLKDVCTFANGKAHEQLVDENGKYILVTSKFIASDGDSYRRTSNRLTPLEIGDLCMVMSDVPNGRALAKCFLVDKDNTYTLNQRIGVFRVDDRYLEKYFYYMLNRNKYFLSFDDGDSQTNLRKDDILNCPVICPSKDIQQRVIDVLDGVARIIAIRKRQLENLDDLTKARFVELFGDPVRNSMEWETYQLDECLERIDNGKSFVCSDKPREDNYPAVLKLSAATYGDYRPSENKALLDEKQFVESAEVHAGDLLFTRKNTPELVGMAAYVQETQSKLMMPDLIFRLVPNEKMNAVFLWQLINCKEFRPVIQAISGGSAKSMSNISKERLGKIKVICPPRKLQDSLVPFIKQVDKSKVAVQKALDETKLLFDSLMQQYFG